MYNIFMAVTGKIPSDASQEILHHGLKVWFEEDGLCAREPPARAVASVIGHKVTNKSGTADIASCNMQEVFFVPLKGG